MALVITAGIFTSCTNKQDATSSTVPIQNPFYNPMYEDGNRFSFAQRIMMDSPEYIAWRTEKIEADKAFVEELNAKEEARNPKPETKDNTEKEGNNNTNNTASNKTEKANTTTTAEQPAKKRKGWSNAAKGTVIGAGTGAVVGVVVSKNKVKGGIVGALLGAGAGYVIGNEKDKKKNNQ